MASKPHHDETRSEIISVTFKPSEKSRLQALAIKLTKPGAVKHVSDLIRDTVLRYLLKDGK